VFLDVVYQPVLFAAAPTGTGTVGQVSDLAFRRSGTAPAATTSGRGG
jgi:hypothetical protein